MTAYLVHRVDSKKLFIAAMVCFVAGCAAALVAPNYPLLLASRLLQAGGAGIALPLIQVVALSVYPKSEYGLSLIHICKLFDGGGLLGGALRDGLGAVRHLR